MASKRNVVFANDQIYHIFNRGIERRTVFTNKHEYQRMVDTLWYYRHVDVPMTLSAYFALPSEAQDEVVERLRNEARYAVSVLTYCLMPNHFHLLVRQNEEKGIQTVLANIANSYTKYFNIKHNRVGPLFQGTFKAVRIETDEQLQHVSRYIHINPVTSYIVGASDLITYPWSSLNEYNQEDVGGFCNTEPILGMFKTRKSYIEFVLDQIDYAKILESIKHLVFDAK